MTVMLRLHSLAWPVTALGPGQRLVIWVAGCRLACPGCITPALQAADSGKDIAIETLARHLLRLPLPLTGVTLSGGEPFEQATALCALWDVLRPARPHWNWLAYSGYRYRSLQRRADARALLARLDALIDGPYRQAEAGHLPWAGSTNQHLRPLTTAGTALCQAWQTDPAAPVVNLGLGSGNEHWLIGIVPAAQRQQLHQQWSPPQPEI
jgi:anaerobic ribonucleoside-triphosphate reductase activating protein